MIKLIFTIIAIVFALSGSFFEFFTLEWRSLRIVRREKPNYIVGTIGILVAILAILWAIWGFAPEI